MFEVLDETDGDVVAVRVSTGSRDGYKDLYELLVSKTEEHGTIYVYEEGMRLPRRNFGNSLSW